MNKLYRFFSARLEHVSAACSASLRARRIIPPAPVAISLKHALNALLERETWARDARVLHAGSAACFSVPPFAFALTVQEDGYIAIAPVDKNANPPAVSMTAPAAALSDVVNGGMKAVMKRARIEGDAEFAATLAKLAEYALEEKPRWLGASAFAGFAAEVVQLRDATERLEKRIACLETEGARR